MLAGDSESGEREQKSRLEAVMEGRFKSMVKTVEKATAGHNELWHLKAPTCVSSATFTTQ